MLRLSSQHYQCIRCGSCCQRYQVAVTPAEAQALQKRTFPTGEAYPASPGDLIHTISIPGGKGLVLKREEGTCRCNALDASGLCIIHKCFGTNAKPLSCRAYPMEFLPTFPGEFSVMARVGCPGTRHPNGKPLSRMRGHLESLLQELPPYFRQWHFTIADQDGLTRDAMETVVAFFIQQLRAGLAIPALRHLAVALDKLGRSFVNDLPTLKQVLPSMASRAQKESFLPAIGATWPERVMLTGQLLRYLRRDEQLPDYTWKTRLRQSRKALAFFLGGGNAAGFGKEHPDFPVAKAQLFQYECWGATPGAPTDLPYREFLLARLETLQFFGRPVNRLPFFKGLLALLDTYPPAVLLARLAAASAQRLGELEASDFQYAAAAIDDIYGRFLQKA